MRAVTDPLPAAPDPWAASEMPRFRSRPPYVMTEMIAAEPALAERLMRRLARDDAVAALVAAIRDAVATGKPLLATGCGTSEHAAMAVALLVDEALGVPPGAGARVVHALDAARSPIGDGLLIAVSHEGGTRVTNEAIRTAREAGATTALITVGGGSPGAGLAEIVVATEEQDQSWCHTVGYLSPVIVGVVLGARLRDGRPDGAATHSLLEVASDARSASSLAAGLAASDRLLVIGAGADYVAARELALKVAEGARLPTESHELETILHGHLAAANRWNGLVLMLTDAEPLQPLVLERAVRTLEAARALAIPAGAIVAGSLSDSIANELTPAGRIVTPRTGRVGGRAASLLTSAMALQLLAERLARARKVDPDTLGREDSAQAAAHA